MTQFSLHVRTIRPWEKGKFGSDWKSRQIASFHEAVLYNFLNVRDTSGIKGDMCVSIDSLKVFRWPHWRRNCVPRARIIDTWSTLKILDQIPRYYRQEMGKSLETWDYEQVWENHDHCSKNIRTFKHSVHPIIVDSVADNALSITDAKWVCFDTHKGFLNVTFKDIHFRSFQRHLKDFGVWILS